MHEYKLGTKATDLASGHEGIVTHYREEIGGHCLYFFQPKGLNAKTLHPHEGAWVPPERLRVPDSVPDALTKYRAMLGTAVKDSVSGFAGMAAALTVHIDGCVHIEVQPAGYLPETGGRITPHDFNVLRLEGPAIPRLSEAEKDVEREQRPSPGPVPSAHPAKPR